jgi:hypothetical protein
MPPRDHGFGVVARRLRAFETGAMPEAICGERVKALGAQSTALRARREQLADEMEEADLPAPTPEELSVLRERVAEAVADQTVKKPGSEGHERYRASKGRRCCSRR